MSNLQIKIFFIFLLWRCIFSQAQLTSDAIEYVNAHNNIRQSRGLPTLSWDPKLATFAQYWATQRADDCNPFIHSLGDYGENIMWELYNEDTPTMITQGWAAEEKNFDLQRHKCRCQPETHDCMCGHYSQVIWRTTTRIGCGNYTCNNQKGFIVVCSYDPPGNFVGEDPYYPSDCGIPSPLVFNTPTTPIITTPTPTPSPPPPPPPSPPPPMPSPPPPVPTAPRFTTNSLTMTYKAPVMSTFGQQLQKVIPSQKGKRANQGRGWRKARRAAKIHRRNYERPRSTPKPRN